jgi:alkyl sulfatase BDS1-like metallo-beta-lactamase superfamily hydrolase
VTDSVYVAVGFALANSILIEGPEGLIIVDTTESRNAAREIYTEFRKVSPHKPVKAIVYTHNHFDHCLGTEVKMRVL